MLFPTPIVIYKEIPLHFIIPLVWIAICIVFFLQTKRCECGAFYHTCDERKEFIKYLLFTISIAIGLFLSLLLWGV